MLIFFWLNVVGGGPHTRAAVHPFSGVRTLSPATLRKMQRREAQRARVDEEETAIALAVAMLMGGNPTG